MASDLERLADALRNLGIANGPVREHVQQAAHGIGRLADQVPQGVPSASRASSAIESAGRTLTRVSELLDSFGRDADRFAATLASGGPTASGTGLSGSQEPERQEPPEAAAESLEKTNPSNNENNCSSCSAAYELRRRGYAVTAPPRTHGRTLAEMEMAWRDPQGAVRPLTSFSTASDAVAEVGAWPVGARGIVGVFWPQRGGHFFNVENVGGRAVFVDAQNRLPDASGFLSRCTYPIHVLRVDDLTFVGSKGWLTW